MLHELIDNYGEASAGIDWIQMDDAELDKALALKYEAKYNLIKYIEANYVPID